MSLKNRLLCATAMLILAGCEQPAPTDDNPALQGEIERLENEIGRLEFRVFQLESLMLPAADMPETPDENLPSAGSAMPAKTAPAQPAGRYDLTPVE